jgi:hypothetical protein
MLTRVEDFIKATTISQVKGPELLIREAVENTYMFDDLLVQARQMAAKEIRRERARANRQMRESETRWQERQSARRQSGSHHPLEGLRLDEGFEMLAESDEAWEWEDDD